MVDPAADKLSEGEKEADDDQLQKEEEADDNT